MLGGSMIATHALAAAVAGCIAFAAAWQVQGWRNDAAVAAIQARHATQVAEAESAYRQKEKSLLAAKNEAEVRYVEQKRNAARSAHGARVALDSLRVAINAPGGGAAADGSATGSGTHGAAARQVVGECAGTLVEVAAEADRLTAIVSGLQGYVRGVCRP